MIAVLVSVFLLFGAMYGFKGTKIERRIDRVRDAIFKQGLADALNKEGMTQQIVDAMNKAHDVFGQPMEEVETGPSGQNEFPAAAAEAETSKIEELEAQA
ncbi:hypothetical protein BG004_003017 [Podila humilis]|nr:hypothetical protein BG004_003017 [Podila humilis]